MGGLVGGAIAMATGGGAPAYFVGWVGGGAAGAAIGAPEDRRKRAAAGGAVGGLLGPLGSAGGAYVATAKPDEAHRRNVAALRRSTLS